ncbi:hypothetical protein [Bacillus sp. NPDC093026]
MAEKLLATNRASTEEISQTIGVIEKGAKRNSEETEYMSAAEKSLLSTKI